ncbi:hypothetical protein HJD18_09575 [Thermoleophilia bacterium SCSIO 60948]|nr:hypothetical protein HJD18_09575 [Thermoleophilia bacterium SCSIO 60948]
MSLLLAWVAFPLVLTALALGCGQLFGRGVDAPLRLGLGLAALVAFGGLVSLWDPIGELLVPGSIVLALAGWAFTLRRRRDRGDRGPRSEIGWAIVAGLGAFVVFGLPVIASGEATFAGYVKLDDTATWLALTDHVAGGADDLRALPPSSYEATLSINLANGYPLGTFAPLALGSILTGQDPAWAFQPYMSVCAAALALALFSLSRSLVPSAPLRVAVALIGGCSALLFGYVMWGGVKEVLAAALIATAYAAVVPRPDRGGGAAVLAVLLVLAAALALSLSPAGVAWIAGAVALALVPAARGRIRISRAALLGALAAVTALGAGLAAAGFLSPFRRSFTDSADLGNLGEPLSPVRLAGIWPAGDFRFDAELTIVAYALIALAVGAALLATWFCLRRRAFAPLAYGLGTLATVTAIALLGSPWVEAKAYAIAAPVIPFLAALGAAVLASRRGLESVGGAVALTALAVGVGWSAALAYGGVTLAPRGQLAELERIGEEFAGEGPTLLTEYQPYAARHFLREAEPEGASELRRRSIPLDRGGVLDQGEPADLDDLDLDAVLVYKTIVLRRSPVRSRPPAPYEMVDRERFYEVWQRPGGAREGPGAPVYHLGLGDTGRRTAKPRCEQVERLKRVARRDDLELVGDRQGAAVELPVEPTNYPAEWERPDHPESPLPRAPGTLTTGAEVERPGEYELWLQGSVASSAAGSIDGEETGRVRGLLNNSDSWISLGSAELDRGNHSVEIEIGGPDLHPGSGFPPLPIGPAVLAPTEQLSGVLTLGSSSAREICARNWDWLELVEPAPDR